MEISPRLNEVMDFLTEYATVQLGAGVHTSRVFRNTHRMGEALGVDVRIVSFQKNAIISLKTAEHTESVTRVVPIPTIPISFNRNSDMSALSWAATDEHLTFDELKRRFNSLLEKKPLNKWIVTTCVALANAAFCRLFGGDVTAMAIVFVSTFLGFMVKSWLQSQQVAHYFIVALTAFVASAIASLAVNFNCTANIAIATSPLFLVPGVPLINGFIDIVEGYVLIGTSRLINALVTVVCIAVGLSLTLIIVKNQLL